MAFTKLTADLNHVQALSDRPNINEGLTPSQLKTEFDKAGNDIKTYINDTLIANLESATPGSSGAESIGSAAITGVTGSNVHAQMTSLKEQITESILGSIPDGSVTPAKLSFDPTTQSYGVTTGAANTYVTTLTPAPAAYTAGMPVVLKIHINNTGASTINVNGLGAVAIKKANGNDVASGNLKLGSIYTLRYNGTDFILQGEGGEYGTAGASQVLTGHTIGTEAGLVNGTIPISSSNSVATSIDTSSVVGRIYLRPSIQYWDGTYSTYADDSGFIAANIPSDINMFGVQGTLVRRGYASGSLAATSGLQTVQVRGLSFTPTVVRATANNTSGSKRSTYVGGTLYDARGGSSGSGYITAITIVTGGFDITIINDNGAGNYEAWY